MYEKSFGIKQGIPSQKGLFLSDNWSIEKSKSSKIDIIPETGIIRKEKKRTFDKSVYEIFATLVLNETLDQYNNLLSSGDFTLYSPQAIGMEYGEQGDPSSLDSVIYEFFCPGTPLNKIQNKRKREYEIDNEPVRIEERAMYLTGILSEIFLKEGICHGDPQLRHLLLLPKEGYLQKINRDGNRTYKSPRNGIGVIDPENMRVLGDSSEEVKKDIDKLISRVHPRFITPRAEEFLDKGRKIVKNTDLRVTPNAIVISQGKFETYFQNNEIASINMEDKKVNYK